MVAYYIPPAGIDDFAGHPRAAAFRQSWHDYIAKAVADRAAEGGLFYDAQFDGGASGPGIPIPWNGFPRSILQWFNADTDPQGMQRAIAAADVLRPLLRLRRADSGETVLVFHRQQDEYCEWHAQRDASGQITRMCFTAEGPEYWEKMAENDPDLVLELYRRHISPNVELADLFWPADMISEGRVVFERGTYNRWNKWNTQLGAMHLTHPANTLGAEINLAADASTLFPGVLASPASTLPTRLICCAGYGGVNRSSDPLIGAGVNGLARAGSSVTLANPVGLYISEIGIDGLRGPDDREIGAQCLNVVRASADGRMKLRVEVTPPPGASYTLDQCRFEGEALRHGGQIARRITMVLFGLAKVIPGRQGRVAECGSKCCTKPDAPNFRLGVGVGTSCGSLTQRDWDRVAPLETEFTAAVTEAIELPHGGIEAIKSSSRAYGT